MATRRPYSAEQLAEATLARQFPPVAADGPAGVVELIGKVGPIQTQVARSAFGAVWSRLPGARCADIEAAYESADLVRGSNLRGTVHTCTRDQHAVLDAVTRRAMGPTWQRALTLQRVEVDEVRRAMEQFATGAWRAPAELRAHLVGWLAQHDSDGAAKAAATPGVGQSMAHVHSGLIRRPLKGPWHGQGAPGYRLAAEVLAVSREAVVADPQAALVDLARIHVAAFGPSSRRDIAWWTGEALSAVDDALVALAEEFTARPGPDGETYHDLAEPPAPGKGPGNEVGLRLLPEFDAVLLGYAPPARYRFVDLDHLPYFWTMSNGMYFALVLHDGRVRASWALRGSGRRRVVDVRMFPRERLLDEGDFTDQVEALAVALGLDAGDLDVRVGLAG
jgi:hypothetical protein